MNRKLIRTTLAEVKGREAPQPKERGGSNSGSGGGGESSGRSGSHTAHRGGGSPQGASSNAAAQGRKRVPPSETSAEIFYYKKQMDAHTLMVIVLQDGEEIEGTIEWYDRAALKVNRKTEPNILLLKHNIKYMYKAEDRETGDTSG